MGYYSDVGFVVSVDNYSDTCDEETKNKFALAVGAFKLLGDKFLQSFDDQIGWRDGRITFYIGSVKWYDDYEDIKQFDAVWEALQEIDGVSGVYVRIGEETTDLEEEYFGEQPSFDEINMRRYIDMQELIDEKKL
jgi:hypothetical protein